MLQLITNIKKHFADRREKNLLSKQRREAYYWQLKANDLFNIVFYDEHACIEFDGVRISLFDTDEDNILERLMLLRQDYVHRKSSNK